MDKKLKFKNGIRDGLPIGLGYLSVSFAFGVQASILGVPFYFHSMRHNLVSRLSKYNIPSNIIVEFVGWSKEGGSAMIGIYDDNEAVDDFGKYFSADGIVKQEEKSLADL